MAGETPEGGMKELTSDKNDSIDSHTLADRVINIFEEFKQVGHTPAPQQGPIKIHEGGDNLSFGENSDNE